MKISLICFLIFPNVKLKDTETTTEDNEILDGFVFENKHFDEVIPDEWIKLLSEIKEKANIAAQNSTASDENGVPEVTGGRDVMKTTATAGAGTIQGPDASRSIVCRIQTPGCIIICKKLGKVIAYRRCPRY